ncbi:putative serine protease HtrA [compost metagenome]
MSKIPDTPLIPATRAFLQALGQHATRRWPIPLALATGIVVGACFGGLPEGRSPGGGGGAASLPPAVAQGAPASFRSLVDRVIPSVVNIDVTRRVRPQVPRGFDRFFETPPSQEQQGVGSGFIIDADGLIVTNFHVIQGRAELSVTLHDGKTYHGRVIGTDPLTDIALVKIEAKGLKPLPLGNSDQIYPGDWVLALGSPLGLQETVTAGIISSVNREVAIAERTNYLQTDAAINPGNSGGPLVNLSGQAVGVNTAIARGAQGIGFAVPVNTLSQVLPELREKGRVERAWLGVAVAEINPQIAGEIRGAKAGRGLVVLEVVAGSPAARAGLQPEDVILSVDGKALTEPRDLILYLNQKKPGQKVRLSVLRGGQTRNVDLTLSTMPASAVQ